MIILCCVKVTAENNLHPKTITFVLCNEEQNNPLC